MSELKELENKLEELEKQRDEAITEIKEIQKQKKLDDLFGTNTLIAVIIHKERGSPVRLTFSAWRKVNKLKAVISELLESEDE